jgi:hypothetical protein
MTTHRFTELLISFETYCTIVAEEEFEKSIEELADREMARIEGRTLFKRYLDRCKELAASDYISDRYSPNIQAVATHKTKRSHPSQDELEDAKLDVAIIEFYRHIFGPRAAGGSSAGITYPNWQSAIAGSFETKESYLAAIEPITKAQKNIVRDRRGLDSYLNVALKMIDACVHTRESMFDLALLSGRYDISSELWEKEGSEYKLTRKAELNSEIENPSHKDGFAYINRQGDLVHSYQFASTVENAEGQTITSEAGDLSPVLLVPGTFSKQLDNPAAVIQVYFGKQHQYKLAILFQSKSVLKGPDNK